MKKNRYVTIAKQIMRESNYDPALPADRIKAGNKARQNIADINAAYKKVGMTAIGANTVGAGNVNTDVIAKRLRAAGAPQETIDQAIGSIILLRGVYDLSTSEEQKKIVAAAREANPEAATTPPPGPPGSRIGGTAGAVSNKIAGIPMESIIAQNLTPAQLKKLRSAGGLGKQVYDAYKRIQNPASEADFYANVRDFNPIVMRGLEGQVDTNYSIVSPAGFLYENSAAGMEQAREDLARLYEGPGKLKSGSTSDWQFDPKTGQVTSFGALEERSEFKRMTGGRGSAEMVERPSYIENLGSGKSSAMAELQRLIVNARYGQQAKALGAPTVPSGMRQDIERQPQPTQKQLDRAGIPTRTLTPVPYEARPDVAAEAARLLEPSAPITPEPTMTPTEYSGSEADIIASEAANEIFARRQIGQRKTRFNRQQEEYTRWLNSW